MKIILISEMNVYKSSRILLSQWRHTVLALSSARGYRENENFTFDWNKVPDTLDKAVIHFIYNIIL